MKNHLKNSSSQFHLTKKFIASFMLWLLLGSLICLAQQGTPQRGTYPQGSYALSDIETINPVNGNLMFHLPLGSLPAGRKGMGAGVGLYYNSKLFDSYVGTACGWDYGTNEYVCSEAQQLYSSPEGGWRYGFQYKLQVYWNPNFDCTYLNAYKVVLSFPDGSIHEFRPYGYPDNILNDGYYQIAPDGTGLDSACHATTLNYGTMTYFSTDGTYLRLDVQHDTTEGYEDNPWTLSLPDGGKVKFKEPGTNGLRIYDSNSNWIEVQNYVLPNGHPVNKVVDQFDRFITIEYGTSSGTLIQVPGANEQTLTWTVTGVDINPWPNYGEYWTNGQNGTVFTLALPWINGVNQIISPSQAGGYAYTFAYRSPSTYEGFGEVKSVTLPSADQNKVWCSPLSRQKIN